MQVHLASLLLLSACASPVWNVELGEGYQEVVTELVAAVEQEMATKGIPALSVALVDGERVVWAQGFGFADADEGRVATADTVYRVGSVSKLFTDIALMRCVENGSVDLDAPVSTYLPSFQPVSNFETLITLRHLTNHTSGLLREPPVGNYFETDAPSLEDTVLSLNGTRLIFNPGARTKYSNAGLAVVGRVLEVLHGRPYPEVMADMVLSPMGIAESAALERNGPGLSRLAKGRMWTYDGRSFDAPTFELGMSPAGSLYASVLDLAKFMRGLFGHLPGRMGEVLQPSSLETMLTPVQSADGARLPFGIGFHVGELDGHRRCGHNGALYGFSTELAYLPEEGLGVVVAASLDGSNTVTRRLADHALRLMLAALADRPLPRLPDSNGINYARGKQLTGLYQRDGRQARLTWDDDRLLLEMRGKICEVRNVGGRFTVDDRHSFGTLIERTDPASIAIDGVSYERVDLATPPPPCPPELAEYVGEYGLDHNVLYIRERDGRLEALIEWFWMEPLTAAGPDRFELPRMSGLYASEEVRFRRDAEGAISAAVLGEVSFERRAVGTMEGETFKIAPLHDPDQLRLMAAVATPPIETGKRASELVDVTTIVPSIRLDLRYATSNNFMSTVFYREAHALMQRPAAEALGRAAENFAALGYGILIHDAYRPWSVTKMFWDATPLEHKQYVADPSKGSRHNRGCAVDITLYDLETGRPIRTTSGYDEFSPRAHPLYPGGTSLKRWYRDTIRSVMERAGFRTYIWEWWHFDYDGWREYPILNVSLEEAGKGD
jgi:D-alanyl-D-alanine dipeptidase/CubicO group peptidase (beta-lactamase class C family)